QSVPRQLPEHGHMTFARSVDQRFVAADCLVDANRRLGWPRHQRQTRDRPAAELQPIGREVEVLTSKAELLLVGGGLEYGYLLLEDLAVADVIRVAVPANIDAKRIRLPGLGAASESAQQAPTRKHVGQRVVFGEAHRV